MLIQFMNCPTHANAAGGKNTARSLFTAKARSALTAVTEPEPKNSFQNFEDFSMVR